MRDRTGGSWGWRGWRGDEVDERGRNRVIPGLAYSGDDVQGPGQAVGEPRADLSRGRAVLVEAGHQGRSRCCRADDQYL
jgi:hypothetical protein